MDFQEAAQLMNDMGFLPDKLTNEMEQQLDDLYTVLNCPKNSPILAENLQNVLMVIDGNAQRSMVLIVLLLSRWRISAAMVHSNYRRVPALSALG